jgi:hypothetical protein
MELSGLANQSEGILNGGLEFFVKEETEGCIAEFEVRGEGLEFDCIRSSRSGLL